MFGIVLVAKDELLKKRIKYFCDKHGFVLLKVFSNIQTMQEEFEIFLPDFVFVECDDDGRKLKNFVFSNPNIQVAIFSKNKNIFVQDMKNVQVFPTINFGRDVLAFMLKNNLFCLERKTGKVVDLNKCVSTFCLEAGIMPHLSGYKYLVYAITLAILDGSSAKFLTKELYPKVGEKFGVSASIVERSMRHALVVAGKTGKLVKINELIEADVFKPYERISNGQFISIVADRFLYNLKILNYNSVITS